MKTKTLPQVILMSLTAILFFGTGCATTKAEVPANAQTENHEEHHPEVRKTAQTESSQSDMMEKGGMMNSGMMGKMDMNQMMGMMNECMKMHKDGKMCDHQTMEKCQENMSKQECMKMMKQAKKEEKSEKKTK